MTDFLKDPIYLEYMEKECDKFLCMAKDAENKNKFDMAKKIASDAKRRFSPSKFYQSNKSEFERLENIT